MSVVEYEQPSAEQLGLLLTVLSSSNYSDKNRFVEILHPTVPALSGTLWNYIVQPALNFEDYLKFDERCQQVGHVDPLEYQRRNFLNVQDDPYKPLPSTRLLKPVVTTRSPGLSPPVISAMPL